MWFHARLNTCRIMMIERQIRAALVRGTGKFSMPKKLVTRQILASFLRALLQ